MSRLPTGPQFTLYQAIATDLLSQQVSQDAAKSIIDKHLDQEVPLATCIEDLLREYFRPLFAGPSNGTAPTIGASQQPGPLWKEQGTVVADQFKRLLALSEAETISKNWPSYVPVLVTLIEDADIRFRQRGLESLSDFVHKCPPRILRSTGVDVVFEKAVFPSLMFLPSITPEAESLTILRPAYAALIQLGELDCDPDDDGKPRRGLLDRLLREGVLAGYAHANEYIRIVEELVNTLQVIISKLRVHATKHLQELLELFSNIMTDPLAFMHPPTVIAASKALQATITCCWPRIRESRSLQEQISYIVCHSWINLLDESTLKAEQPATWNMLNDALVTTAAVLRAVCTDDGAWKALEAMIQDEPEIKSFIDQANAHYEKLRKE